MLLSISKKKKKSKRSDLKTLYAMVCLGRCQADIGLISWPSYTRAPSSKAQATLLSDTE